MGSGGVTLDGGGTVALSDNAGKHTSNERVSLIRRRTGKGEILIENVELERGVLRPLQNVTILPPESPAGHLVGGRPYQGPALIAPITGRHAAAPSEREAL